jgi:uncharacterized protein (TIGR02466 family)
MNIISLFPTSLLKNKINLSFNLNETLQNFHFNQNTGYNYFTENQRVLEENIFVDLKNEILKNINLYFLQILKTSDTVKPYITSSWINITKEGESHHIHTHSNSILSGVFYLQADELNDTITFYNSKYNQIKICPTEYTLYNSDSWKIPVSTGDLILFPSSLEHGVDICKSKIRISLAFNVFITGTIGDTQSSNFLQL